MHQWKHFSFKWGHINNLQWYYLFIYLLLLLLSLMLSQKHCVAVCLLRRLLPNTSLQNVIICTLYVLQLIPDCPFIMFLLLFIFPWIIKRYYTFSFMYRLIYMLIYQGSTFLCYSYADVRKIHAFSTFGHSVMSWKHSSIIYSSQIQNVSEKNENLNYFLSQLISFHLGIQLLVIKPLLQLVVKA